MKLLVVTQAVDRRHPVLGFFHRWLEEFGATCDRVVVVGQHVGEHALPPNVAVRTLGKESGTGIVGQILRFWGFCLREDYDAAFVHMSPAWIVLGAPIWLLRGKRPYLWYEVRRGGWVLKAAVACSRAVFSATRFGLPWPSPKQRVVGHGIDTALFHPPTSPRNERELLAVGRVTRIKRLDAIVGCLASLPAEYRLRLIGPVVTDADRAYKAELDALIARSGLRDRVTFETADQRGIADALRRARLFVHGSGGALDKALLEAMSCGCMVVSCSEAAVDTLPPACLATVDALPAAVRSALALPAGEAEAIGAKLRAVVERDHALPRLIDRLVSSMAA